MIIAETTRLIVRHFVADDAVAMCGVFGDAEVMRFSMTGVVDEPWVRAFIERCRRNYEQRGYGLWALARRDDERVLGYCGLTRFPDIDGRPEVEVGYRLIRTHWGNGYATEAASAVRDYAVNTLGITRLIALIDPANVASIRIAEKIGMHHAKDVLLDGFDHPDRMYLLESNR